MSTGSTENDEARFARLFHSVYGDVVRFAARRVDDGHAEDVVAEAFPIAWRRLDDLPASDGDRRAWLFGITRGVIMNAVRGARRREALGVRLASVGQGADPGHEDLVVRQLDMSRAWQRLSAVHQESLALATFDGLDAVEAAAVLSISPVAFRLRLSRARRALRANLEHLPEPSRALNGAAREQLAR